MGSLFMGGLFCPAVVDTPRMLLSLEAFLSLE